MLTDQELVAEVGNCLTHAAALELQSALDAASRVVRIDQGHEKRALLDTIAAYREHVFNCDTIKLRCRSVTARVLLSGSDASISADRDDGDDSETDDPIVRYQLKLEGRWLGADHEIKRSAAQLYMSLRSLAHSGVHVSQRNVTFGSLAGSGWDYQVRLRYDSVQRCARPSASTPSKLPDEDESLSLDLSQAPTQVAELVQSGRVTRSTARQLGLAIDKLDESKRQATSGRRRVRNAKRGARALAKPAPVLRKKTRVFARDTATARTHSLLSRALSALNPLAWIGGTAASLDAEERAVVDFYRDDPDLFVELASP